jgi:hypothetical protein
MAGRMKRIAKKRIPITFRVILLDEVMELNSNGKFHQPFLRTKMFFLIFKENISSIFNLFTMVRDAP